MTTTTSSTGTVIYPPATVTPTTTTAGTDTTTTVTAGREPVTPASWAGCAITRGLIVEVSDARAVGIVTVPLGPSVAQPVDVLSDQAIGVAEQSPITVVVAHTTGETTSVRADFTGGMQDEMSVVNQWAVLVNTPASARSGAGNQSTTTSTQANVYALSSDGTVLEHTDLPGAGALAMSVAACAEPHTGTATVPSSQPTTTTTGSSDSGSTTGSAKASKG
jgi:hypothetical protein